MNFLINGVSLGKREIDKWGHAEWKGPFTRGELKAVAYGTDGSVVACDVRKTTGAPVALKLIQETDGLRAGDMAILTCVAIDADGNEVPTATPTVHFMANGKGRVYSTGSSVCDHKTIFSPDRKMYAGRIGVAVKLGAEAGKATVFAEADGLLPASLTLEFGE